MTISCASSDGGEALTPEQELFYDDFVSSGLLSLERLQQLSGESADPDVNPLGTRLRLLDRASVVVAQIKVDRQQFPPIVEIDFAGERMHLPLNRLEKDLG